MSDLKAGAIERIKEMALQLKTVREESKKLENYARSRETQILGLFEAYGIGADEIKGVAIKSVPVPKEIVLNDILAAFPNTDIKTILENVVGGITLDLAKTEENLRFAVGFPESLVRSIVKQLEKLSKETVKKVEV